jgi:drug/metabolite transporter (DMT)-like permease
MFVVASLLWALFTALLKRWQVHAFDVTLGVVATAAITYLPIYVLFIPKHLAEASQGQIALQAFFQGVIVVCVAMWTYAKATALIGPSRLAILMASVPAVGSLLGVLVLHEALGAGAMLGVATTSAGALIGALARPKGDIKPAA